MSERIIRPAIVKDAETLERFNVSMAWETEAKTLEADRIKSGIEKIFADPDSGFYSVVEVDERVVAALMITTEWSDWRNGYFWWIQSVYVEPDYRGKGIFTSLYAYIKNMASSNDDVCGLRLYVEKENDRAQRTYLKAGMHETVYRLYEEEF